MFKDVPPPDSSMGCEKTRYDFIDDDGDDGLGFYPDGVKRTLTDEQIAMFRHSEIYALLRERRMMEENQDASSPEPKQNEAFNHVLNPAVEAQRVLAECIEGDEEDDDEEYAAFLAAEQKQIQEDATRSNRKRKVDEYRIHRDRKQSTRRIVREMDEAGADDTVLDYGDEPHDEETAVLQSLYEEDLGGVNTRKRMKYGTKDGDSTSKTPAVQGRKIWWPAIGN